MTRLVHSDYMTFAKFEGPARFSLASSGIADADLAGLGLSADDLALAGPNVDGYGPLVACVAERFGVDPASVVMPGGGCSFANHLAIAALVEPGDEVLVESPTYGLLTDTLRFHQARLKRFDRPADEDWRLDAARVAAALTSSTRLVVATNLHNPSSAPADDETMGEIAGMCRAVGARLLIDEVYRELVLPPGEARTAFRPGSGVVVTSSLTKAYGLSGLRCGWVLADPPLAERMRRLNDLFGVHPPHVSERLAVAAFAALDRFRSRAEAILEENREAWRALLGDHPRLQQTVFETGTTVFPRLVGGDVDALFVRLKADEETTFVPGRFFGAPDHLRIGLGGRPEPTRTGLERLAAALDRPG